MLGKIISHYRIQEKLGGGGMGVVYKGRDTLLDRAVAIKVLSPELLADETAARGFIREAKAASALNHPNILTVHDLVEAEGVHFLVMEYVEGQTLRARIGKKGLELKPLLDISLEVAEALAAAHRAGIVHRDLKPENIMVRTDGHIKVVDFGLAKLLPTRPTVLATGESTILLPGVPLPTPGVGIEQTHIAGTLPYMSPEQLTGKPLDHRTDIYSFGVVLYEMATGQQPHQGRTTAEIVESILTKEPRPATDLSRVVPDKLQEIIGKTMEKDPADRYQHMEDVAVDLRRLKRTTESAGRAVAAAVQEVAPKPARWRRWRKPVLALAAGIVLVAGALAAWRMWPQSVPKVLKYTQITNDGRGKVGPLLWDGSKVYFIETSDEGNMLVQVPAGGGEPVRIPTPWKVGELLDISPDKRNLLVARLVEQAEFWTVPVAGGSPRKLPHTDIFGSPTWSSSGDELVYPSMPNNPGLRVSKIDGSETRSMVRLMGNPDCLSKSPDGKTLRFLMNEEPGHPRSLWDVSLSGAGLRQVLPAERGGLELSCGNWTPGGDYFVFEAEKEKLASIWVLREPRTLSRHARREPVQLTAGPMAFSVPLPVSDRKVFAIGTLQHGELVRYDLSSKQFVPFLPGVAAEGVTFSKDGQWVAYTTYREGALWRSRGDGTEKLQLATPPMRAAMPRWSPDGKQIAFTGKAPDKPWQVYTVSRDGGPPQQITSTQSNEGDPTWSPDGNSIMFSGVMGGGNFEPGVRIIDLRTREVSEISPPPQFVFSPRWSPTGRYLTVISFMPPGTMLLYDFTSKKWRELMSREGIRSIGWQDWSPDGAYLYYEKTTDHGATMCRMGTRDWKEEEVVTLKDVKRAQGEFGAWCGVTPDGSPLLLRDTGTQEIYALNLELP